ncbi:hypothetical protein [Rubinisphaera italica]|uniref:hypothetical protein n=1 Tax=Rubinisphaera italica TaxID=2527969 RepID=UPI0011B4228A|nr:hypothetical protein [Rubinisphaera italica]
MKVNWTAQELAELCRRECTTLVFWKSLGIALLWSLLNLGIVFVGGHIIRWTFRVHELFSFLFIPIPIILIVGSIAGWIHNSVRIRKMVYIVSGLAYLAAIPLILLAVIMAMGFASVR